MKNFKNAVCRNHFKHGGGKKLRKKLEKCQNQKLRNSCLKFRPKLKCQRDLRNFFDGIFCSISKSCFGSTKKNEEKMAEKFLKNNNNAAKYFFLGKNLN